MNDFVRKWTTGDNIMQTERNEAGIKGAERVNAMRSDNMHHESRKRRATRMQPYYCDRLGSETMIEQGILVFDAVPVRSSSGPRRLVDSRFPKLITMIGPRHGLRQAFTNHVRHHWFRPWLLCISLPFTRGFRTLCPSEYYPGIGFLSMGTWGPIMTKCSTSSIWETQHLCQSCS